MTVRPFADMAAGPVGGDPTGLLWAINRTLFHPRGFALSFHMGTDGQVDGWTLDGDGTEPWAFNSADDDECFTTFEAFLALTKLDARRAREAATCPLTRLSTEFLASAGPRLLEAHK